MKKQAVFIQGAGDEGYEADAALAASLRSALGKEYELHYPKLQSNESAADFGWVKQIQRIIVEINGSVILAGHSLGASMLLKCLSEQPLNQTIEGLFLIATPFWSGNEAWKTGLKLREDFAVKLPDHVPIYFYHCQDDDEVPFAHLGMYKQYLPQATFREINTGGHQLNNDLTIVAKDIQSEGLRVDGR